MLKVYSVRPETGSEQYLFFTGVSYFSPKSLLFTELIAQGGKGYENLACLFLRATLNLDFSGFHNLQDPMQEGSFPDMYVTFLRFLQDLRNF